MTGELIFYSILCSMVASFIFLFIVLFMFKPKIKISKNISKSKFKPTDSENCYFIKIVNKSLFSAYDVRFELLQVEKYSTTNGHMNCRQTSLTLVSDTVSCIRGYRPSWIRKNAPYALRIRTKDDLTSILTDDYKCIVLEVTLRHGLTGLVKVHSQEFTLESQVIPGKFEYGLKFGII